MPRLRSPLLLILALALPVLAAAADTEPKPGADETHLRHLVRDVGL